MRCRWGLASLLSALSFPLTVSAQEADVSAGVSAEQGIAPSQAIAYGAMPGGLHAPTAETLPKGAIQVSTLTGLGQRSGLLGPDHKFTRGVGDLAIAFGATEYLSIGVSFDGRYDRHSGAVGDATKNTMTTTPVRAGEDGYVGDPHLIVRVAKGTGSTLFGGQVGIWVPGKDAPSVAGSAISIDARALVSLPAGPGLLSFSGGFRLDNSAKSVDDPMSLSLSDRVSLGVSVSYRVRNTIASWTKSQTLAAFTRWRGEAIQSAPALELVQGAAIALGGLSAAPSTADPAVTAALLSALDDSAFPEIVSSAALGLGAMSKNCTAAAKAKLLTIARSNSQAATSARHAAGICGR